MIQTFKKYLGEALRQRASEISNDLTTSNSEYGGLSRRIIGLEEKLATLLPDEGKNILDEYIDIILQRDALVLDNVYRQGLEDGIELVDYLQKGDDKGL